MDAMEVIPGRLYRITRVYRGGFAYVPAMAGQVIRAAGVDTNSLLGDMLLFDFVPPIGQGILDSHAYRVSNLNRERLTRGGTHIMWTPEMELVQPYSDEALAAFNEQDQEGD